ncbi:MAG: DUF1292 domain-containing protein [Clostridiales bacterium]|nr:DUF1292 domain-containing protein [Lachnospiraceae bacterium]MCD8151812.1 DUF1292 domain-containing protein [Clostridiales bacterium]
MENIRFTDPDSGEEVLFYVLEQTCIGGVSYLLVTEDEEEDSYAYILKEIQTDGDEVIYAMVEDDVELGAITKVFAEMLEDVDFDCQ